MICSANLRCEGRIERTEVCRCSHSPFVSASKCVCVWVCGCVCVRVPAHVIIQISVDKDIDMGILPKVSLEAKWEDDPKQAFNSEPLLTKESQPRPVRTA